MTIFLCHNCSNLNSKSGEACILKDDYHEGKDKIVHGDYKCLRRYTVPLTEKEKKESPIIMPDNFEWDFETYFYKVESEETISNYTYVLSSPLWDVLFNEIRPLSNEESLWVDAKDQIHKYRQMNHSEKLKEIRINKITAEAYAFLGLDDSCRPGIDPILNQ